MRRVIVWLALGAALVGAVQVLTHGRLLLQMRHALQARLERSARGSAALKVTHPPL